MMLDATQNAEGRLTDERLFDWHAALFPTGRSGMRRARSAGGATDRSRADAGASPGRSGRERVHFEAPAATRLRTGA